MFLNLYYCSPGMRTAEDKNPRILASSGAGVVSLPCGMMILAPIGAKIIIPQGERLKVRLPGVVGAVKMVKFAINSKVWGLKPRIYADPRIILIPVK